LWLVSCLGVGLSSAGSGDLDLNLIDCRQGPMIGGWRRKKEKKEKERKDKINF